MFIKIVSVRKRLAVLACMGLFFSSLTLANEQRTRRDQAPDLPVFTESLIFGTVYVDANNNRTQDSDEPGVMGVRLVTISGDIITTDSNGRYSLTGTEPVHPIRGGNFVIKIDKGSIPNGLKIMSNPTVAVRLTMGMPQQIDFRLIAE